MHLEPEPHRIPVHRKNKVEVDDATDEVKAVIEAQLHRHHHHLLVHQREKGG